MSIQEVYTTDEGKFQIVSSHKNDSAYTLIDTVNQQAVTAFLSESDDCSDDKSKKDLVKENALLKRQLSLMQVSTYKESLGIIQHLTEQNMLLSREKEAITHMLIAEQDKFHQLKNLVEPALKNVMEDVTQNLVTKLMKRVPDLNTILLESTKEDGMMNFQLLIKTLEAHSLKEKQTVVELDDDLCEWQEIVEYDLAEAFNITSSTCKLLPLTYHDTKVTDTQMVSGSDKFVTQQTVIISEVKGSDFDQLIDQLKLLQETYGENPSFHTVKTEDYIIIDGQKLDKEGALSMLVTYIGMVGKGACIAGKSTFYMLGTVVQLASFVGLGISVFASPWTAAFLLLGRFSYPVLRLAIGI